MDSHYTDWPPGLPAHEQSLHRLRYPSPLVSYGAWKNISYIPEFTKLGIHSAPCQKSTKCSVWVTIRRSVIWGSHSNADKYTSLLGYDVMSTVNNIVDKLAVFIFIIVHGVMSQQNCIVINKIQELIRKFVHCRCNLKKNLYTHTQTHTHTHTILLGSDDGV